MTAYYRWIIIIFKFVGLAYIAFLFEIFNVGLEKMFLYQQMNSGSNEDGDGDDLKVLMLYFYSLFNNQNQTLDELVANPPVDPISRKARASETDVQNVSNEQTSSVFISASFSLTRKKTDASSLAHMSSLTSLR